MSKVKKNLHYVKAFYEANGQEYGEASDFSWHQLLLTQELQTKEDNLGKTHPELADTLHKLGLTYFAQGEFELAEDFWQRAIRVQAKKSDDPLLLETKRCLAILAYYPMGKTKETESIFDELGKQNPVVLAEALNDLAAINVKLKNFDKAAKFYGRSIDVWKQALGEEDPSLPDLMDNLAGIYYYKGDFVKAKETSKNALDLANKVLGADHPETAKIANNFNIITSQP